MGIKSTGGFVIEPMSQDDLNQVADLLGSVWGPRSTEYLAWKYQYTHPNQLLLARDPATSEVVGFHAFIQWPILFESRVHDAVQSVDLVVHEQYRRRGLMQKMRSQNQIAAQKNGSIIASGWAGYESPSYTGLLKAGWTSLGRMPEMLYAIEPYGAAKWLGYGPIRTLMVGTFLLLRNLVRHPRVPKVEGLVLKKGRWDFESFSRCWGDSLEPHAAAASRDSGFYRRRFSKSMWQSHEFVPIFVQENGRTVCFAVCIVCPTEMGAIGAIADMHSTAGSTEALQLLVAACVDYFKREGVAYIRTWAKKPEAVVKVLSKSGFLHHQAKACFMLCRLDESSPVPPGVMDFDVWDLDICDTDHV